MLRLSGPPAVWRGTAGAGRGVQVIVRGPPGNPDGCGTVLRLRDATGERIWRVRSSAGWQASRDPRAVFAFRSAGTLTARLPDGRLVTQSVEGPGALTIAAGAP